MVHAGNVLAALALVNAAAGAGYPVVPAQPAPLAQAPTVPPTALNVLGYWNKPEDERCLELKRPPGVKPAACAQVTCMPETLMPGNQFRVTVRFCLQRPRRWHLAFALLDMVTKEYYMGDGNGIVDMESQCAEVTFTDIFDVPPEANNLMWKFYVVANWGNANDYVEDVFPNMLAETGVPMQPDYTQPLDPANMCPETDPNPRMWSYPPTGFQNAIDYAVVPPCFQPNAEWAVQVNTHVETVDEADLHCNLQIGSGADVFLGPADLYLTETDVPGLQANPVAKSWAALPPNYWTINDIVFTPEQTGMVQDGQPVYLSCFLVPAGAIYNAAVPGGWHLLEREFFTSVQFCDGAAAAASSATGSGSASSAQPSSQQGSASASGSMSGQQGSMSGSMSGQAGQVSGSMAGSVAGGQGSMSGQQPPY